MLKQYYKINKCVKHHCSGNGRDCDTSVSGLFYVAGSNT